MATISTTTTLGSNVANAGFVENSRIWAGGGTTYDGTETLRITNGTTLTASDCTIKVTGGPGNGGILWDFGQNTQGTYVFDNVTIMADGLPANSAGADNLTFNNVTILTTGLTGQATWGNWRGAQQQSTMIINGLNLWFNPAPASNTLATGNFFAPNITAQSQLNGFSLWNGQTGDESRGSGITMGNQVFSGLVSGPLGGLYAGTAAPTDFRDGTAADTTRFLLRYSANGNGILLSYDYRAIDGVAGDWLFSVETGDLWMINPLEGFPAGSLRTAVAFTTSQGGDMIRAVGQLPATTSGDIKFVNHQPTTSTLYTLPDTISATSIPTEVTVDIITNEGTTLGAGNGLLLVANDDTFTATGSTVAAAPLLPELSASSYRTYSWQQNDWGTVRTITPTTNGATDAVVATDRGSGAYPEINTTGFLSSIDINAGADVLTSDFITHALAEVELYGTLAGTSYATTGRHLAASLKAAHYAGITTTAVDLPYTLSGTTLTFTPSVVLSATATAAPGLTGGRIIPARDILVDANETVTTVAAPNITITGDVLDQTLTTGNTKCILHAPNGIIAVDESVLNAADGSMNNVIIDNTATVEVDNDVDSCNISCSSITVGGGTSSTSINATLATLTGGSSNVTLTGGTTVALEGVDTNGTYTSTTSNVNNNSTGSSFTGDVVLSSTTNRAYTNMTVDGNISNRRAGHTITGLTIEGTSRTLALIGYSGTVTVDAVFGTGFSNDNAITLSSNANVTITVTSAEASLINGATFSAGTTQTLTPQITLSYPAAAAAERTFQVPSGLRNGFFGVRNLTTNTNVVAPVAVNSNASATYSITYTSDDRGTDDIMIYWRPRNTAATGYDTTFFEVPTTIVDGDQDLPINRRAAVLWEDLTSTVVLPGGVSVSIFDGDQNLAGVDRAEIRYVDTSSFFSDTTNGQVRTMYATVVAANDTDYLLRLMDNELESDIISAGIGETVVDGRYAYLDSTNTTTQVSLFSVNNGAPGGASGDLTPVAVTGVTGLFTINVIANPAGATPGQIAAAVGGGVSSGLTTYGAATISNQDDIIGAVNSNPLTLTPGTLTNP